MQTCPQCNEEKEVCELCPKQWKRQKHLCRECAGTNSTTYRSTLNGMLNDIMKHTRDAARKRSVRRPACGVVEIDKDFISNMADLQDMRCAVSGMKMEWIPRSPHKVSVDRIDCQVGYTKANSRLVCWIVNSAMSDFAFEDFLTMCSSVRDLHVEKKNLT